MHNLIKTTIAATLLVSFSTGCSQHSKQAKENTISPMTYYASANLMASKQEYNEAIKQYRLAIEGDPNMTRAYNRLGICHHQIDELHHAEATFTQAVDKQPDSPVLLNNLGFTYLRERRFEEAEQKFRDALEISPGFAKARMNLGIALAKMNRLGESIMEFGRVVPTEIAYYNAAVVRLEEKDYAGASWALDKSLEHNPNFEPAKENVDQIRYMAKQQEPKRGKRIDIMPPKIVVHTRKPDATANEPRKQCQDRMSPPSESPASETATQADEASDTTGDAGTPDEKPADEAAESDPWTDGDHEDETDTAEPAGAESDPPSSDDASPDATGDGNAGAGEPEPQASATGDDEPATVSVRAIGPTSSNPPSQPWVFDCDDPFEAAAQPSSDPQPPLAPQSN